MKFPILLPNIFDHPFTYESSIDLKLGDYVEVPFGKSKITGVVWDEFEKNSNKTFKIKKVLRKLDVTPLKKNTIKFLNWFSEYNIIPKGMALKLILLSSHAIENKELSSYDNFKSEIKNTSIKLTKDQIKAYEEMISDNQNFRVHVLQGTTRCSPKVSFKPLKDLSISLNFSFSSELSKAPFLEKLLYFFSKSCCCSEVNFKLFFCSKTVFILLKSTSFRAISFENSDRSGETFWAIFWISSLVSAALRLKNKLEIRSNSSPENSKVSIVFSNVGGSLFSQIEVMIALAFLIAVLKAGKKSVVFIFEKGAVPYGVSKRLFRMFMRNGSSELGV